MKTETEPVAVPLEDLTIMAVSALSSVLSAMSIMRNAGVSKSWESPGLEVYEHLYGILEDLEPERRGSVVLALLISVGLSYAEAIERAKQAADQLPDLFGEGVQWQR